MPTLTSVKTVGSDYIPSNPNHPNRAQLFDRQTSGPQIDSLKAEPTRRRRAETLRTYPAGIFVVPGHGPFVIRLTGYLTLKCEGYEK